MNNTTPWIIIMTHGKFGVELKKSAELILGNLKNVYCISLMEGTDPADLAGELNSILEKAPDNTIIFSDLYGGTPCNVSAIYAANNNYTVISGLNLTMLVEAETARLTEDYDNLAERLMTTGKNGIDNIREKMKERRNK